MAIRIAKPTPKDTAAASTGSPAAPARRALIGACTAMQAPPRAMARKARIMGALRCVTGLGVTRGARRGKPGR